MAPQAETSSAEADPNDSSSSVRKISVDELAYGFESFHAIAQPVTITMILSSLAVVYINTPETQAAGEAAISQFYTVTGSASDADSNGAALGQALLNALVIVGVICVITFLLVLLYKWRCMKLLMGYMILASAMLLGYLSSAMWNMAIQIYGLHVDKITFAVAIYNFGLVGCGAIFYGKGIPMTVTQGYLILSSVIVAWQLSYFDSWTAWLLLIMLALYDLFAVLSPCGPLKALVKLMQRENAPAMPGLLYEANVQARRPEPRNNTTDASNSNSSNNTGNTPPASTASGNDATEGPSSEAHHGHDGSTEEPSMVHVSYDNGHLLDDEAPRTRESNTIINDQASRTSILALAASTGLETREPTSDSSDVPPNNPSIELESGATVEVPSEYIPLAIAKRYRLPTVDDPWPRWMPNEDGSPSTVTFAAEELRSLVHVRFPIGGGRIEVSAARRPNEETRYEVYDRDGILKRVLFVNARGEIYQDLRGMACDDSDDDNSSRNNIKLGLGDFIFYSILVAKAASYSFTAFVACSVVILIGLLGTLVLLGVYGKALPALPISIFLGVIFYLLTRYLMQPWIQMIFIEQSYV